MNCSFHTQRGLRSWLLSGQVTTLAAVLQRERNGEFITAGGSEMVMLTASGSTGLLLLFFAELGYST